MDIYICDDEKMTCAQLEDIILEYSAERNCGMEISVFYSGDALIDFLKKNDNPVILFLDIELPGANGVEVGNYIREQLEDENMFIVYISSQEQYAMQLFDNHPYSFLIKPLDRTKIYKVLDGIYKKMNRGSAYFEFQSQKIIHRISYSDIQYFQSIGKKVNIHGQKEIQSFYGKLSDVEKKLKENCFLNVHKSYLVNYNYVKEYTYDQVKMFNGDRINISKANRASVRKQVLAREKNGI